MLHGYGNNASVFTYTNNMTQFGPKNGHVRRHSPARPPACCATPRRAAPRQCCVCGGCVCWRDRCAKVLACGRGREARLAPKRRRDAAECGAVWVQARQGSPVRVADADTGGGVHTRTRLLCGCRYVMIYGEGVRDPASVLPMHERSWNAGSCCG